MSEFIAHMWYSATTLIKPLEYYIDKYNCAYMDWICYIY